MSVQLLGKRELKRLASVANDGAGTGYNGFAKGMMAKMGWQEGQGLGKDAQGRATYVQVKKKDDNAGLGKEKAQQNNVNDQWYFDAFDSALANMGGKKKKKKDKKSKKKSGSDKSSDGDDSMYDKMFKATGGARMGMRARASQNGKLARTEGGHDGTGDVGTTADDTATAAAALKDEPKDGTGSRTGAAGEALEGSTSRKRRRAAAGADVGKEGTEQSSVAVAEGEASIRKRKEDPMKFKAHSSARGEASIRKRKEDPMKFKADSSAGGKIGARNGLTEKEWADPQTPDHIARKKKRLEDDAKGGKIGGHESALLGRPKGKDARRLAGDTAAANRPVKTSIKWTNHAVRMLDKAVSGACTNCGEITRLEWFHGNHLIPVANYHLSRAGRSGTGRRCRKNLDKGDGVFRPVDGRKSITPDGILKAIRRAK